MEQYIVFAIAGGLMVIVGFIIGFIAGQQNERQKRSKGG